MAQSSSSDDSSSDSDDEMRSRLLETVVTVEQIKKDGKKKGFGFIGYFSSGCSKAGYVRELDE